VVLEGDDVTPLFIDRPREIVVLHTGRKMDTAAALNDRRPEESDMKLLGESCRRFLGERDWIRAMDEHARVLERSGVVPAFVSETSRAWKAAGLVRALKTTGAGGGDALLAWSPVDKHATLRAEAERLGWWLSPLAWNAEGLREETAS
jgi:mevalonate kinase